MTQSVVVQVGQCGNQVGCRFWDLVLREHAAVNQKGIYDEAISSFFRNVDTRVLGDGGSISRGKICSLKARAVLIDMEEGVVNEVLQGPLRDVFDRKQVITDNPGSGNNWAVGHKVFGARYHEHIAEALRTAAEHCDCLQCFFVVHSMGGGTGSGLGTFLLKVLEDEFPEVHRFVTSVYPSAEDDVVTSPYNSLLAMKELNEHADCVLPIDNQSLIDIISKIDLMVSSGKSRPTIKPNSLITSGAGAFRKQPEKPFDAMNNIVANLLLNLTSSARFQGSLNMDLSEISMNLVPFPQLHYLVSSLTPLYTLADVHVPPRRLDQMFSDAFSKDHQLIRADPRHSLYLACALMAEAFPAVRLLESRRLEDQPVLSAPGGPFPCAVSAGQQHVREANPRGPERPLPETLQEEGSPSPLPASGRDGGELLLGSSVVSVGAHRGVQPPGRHQQPVRAGSTQAEHRRVKEREAGAGGAEDGRCRWAPQSCSHHPPLP